MILKLRMKAGGGMGGIQEEDSEEYFGISLSWTGYDVGGQILFFSVMTKRS